MKIIILSALVYLAFSAANDKLLCNSVLVGTVYQPVGVCLGAKAIVANAAVTSSTQYVCAGDGNSVIYRKYTDSDCAEGATDVNTYTNDFTCAKSGCPIFEYRLYVATPNGDTCSKEESFMELVYPVDFCFVGQQWKCTDTGLKHRNYLNNLLVDAFDKTALNCTNGDYAEQTLVAAGCDASKRSFVTVEACSMTGKISVFMVAIVVTIFVFINQ
eukprot:527570_1